MSTPLTEIRAAALGYLARREHSRAELRHKLRAKDFAPADIDRVLDALEAERLQSDARFTESYLYSRIQRGYGPLRLRQELQQRGVDAELARTAIESSEQDWCVLARQLRHKRFGPAPPRDFKDKARQLRFLSAHGFDREQINAAFADDTDTE